MAIVIKGGKIVTAEDMYDSDVRIEEGKIVAIGNNIECDDDEVLKVYGCYVLPGAIDTHTHFDLEVGNTVTADDFESGTKAAIVGGTTTVLDFATQNKGNSLKSVLKNWNKKAEGKAFCDYGFHMAITDWNKDISKEMEEMIKVGITSFKMYMAYKGSLQVDDGTIFKALKRSNEVGALIGFHCENGDIIDVLVKEEREKGHLSPAYHPITRPKEMEREAIRRLLSIAKVANAPVYIVHLSSKEGLDAIVEAKNKGQEIYVETCPQYLFLDDRCYGNKDSKDFEGAKFVISPPLRKEEDKEGLWNGIRNSYISTVGTDHCSFNYKGQKDIGINDFSKIPNGAPGVEHRLSLMYTYGVLTGKISINQMIALTSTNPAKIFGIFPEKGTVAVGSDADIVIWNPEPREIITAKNQIQKVDYTPYEGYEIKGKVQHVFLRGNHIVKDSKLVEKEAIGKYIHRKHLKRGD
ncbi:dihydropyrimidinase [Tepidibacter aestuarii]|uniref:dihydropyrimidinase n=1 Tax=Tepidibacter aestuarii TaxID=2925782 RepID=UPI0020C14333|nr:dihydropyrimidinase [Tepidibacter aestuarii]CAH2213747.1 phenylhydantoinase [Tepidibacter aestuarii]